MSALRRGGPEPACVIGEIDLVRALGLAGIGSTVVSPPGDFTRYSRHRRAAIRRLDAARQPEQLTERLLDYARSRPEKPVLFYNGDWDLLMVSRLRERLSEGFRFVIADAETVEDLVNKRRFQQRAVELDLPVPAAYELVAGGALPTNGLLRYPLVVKPLTREHATWRALARSKVRPVTTAAELEPLCEDLAAAGLDVLLQEAIPGPESLIESHHVYVDADGEVAGEFTGRKIRTYPCEYGYSTALEVTDAPDVAALGREVLERLEFRGVAKLDFKRHPDDGRLSLLEINPRFNLWHHPGARAGVNIPALVYADLTGRPRGPVTTARAGVRWCSPWRDFQAVRQSGDGLLRWIPWMLSAEAKCAIAWDDPLPLPAAGARRLVRRGHAAEKR
jgi:predicted ATP-grasp superfamily ATP-dependent carboligase